VRGKIHPENGYALPATLGDVAERALPSSGEKLVNSTAQRSGSGAVRRMVRQLPAAHP